MTMIILSSQRIHTYLHKELGEITKFVSFSENLDVRQNDFFVGSKNVVLLQIYLKDFKG